MRPGVPFETELPAVLLSGNFGYFGDEQPTGHRAGPSRAPADLE